MTTDIEFKFDTGSGWAVSGIKTFMSLGWGTESQGIFGQEDAG